MTTTNLPIAEERELPPPEPSPRAWVFSLQRSPGGVPKLPIREALATANGLDGDVQRHLEYHGGPDRALCLYSLERILTLQQEGHLVYPGALGENLTLVGLDWSRVVPGVTLQIGGALAEVTDYAVPCRTIMRAFADSRFSRVSQKAHPGFSRVYARVLSGGLIRVADEVVVAPQAAPQPPPGGGVGPPSRP